MAKDDTINVLDFNFKAFNMNNLSYILETGRGTLHKWSKKGIVVLRRNKTVDLEKTVEGLIGNAKFELAEKLENYIADKHRYDKAYSRQKGQVKRAETIEKQAMERQAKQGEQPTATKAEIVDNIVQSYDSNKLNSVGLKYNLTKFEAEGYLKTAQAIMAMREEEQQRGILVDVREVAKQVENVIMIAKAQLLTLPTKLAPKMVKIKKETLAQETLTREISECLAELSKMSGELNKQSDSI